MRRVVDILAIAAVAVVLLVPQPSVVAQPALAGDPMELDRLAALEDARYRHPGEIEPALRLADEFLSFMRADWALMTLDEFAGRGDWRVHLLRATARAERLEAKQAIEEAKLGEQACAAAKCPAGDAAKLGLMRAAMQALVDENIDPAKEPQKARNAVSRVLHSAKFKMPAMRPSLPAGKP